MARQLTDKQMHILRFIYDYIKSNGCAPTQKEIGEALDIPVSAAQGRIQMLFGHGCLRKSEIGQWRRSVALTEKGILSCESFNDNRPAPTNS
jgi:SOS-response transcriptional repressor LexA